MTGPTIAAALPAARVADHGGIFATLRALPARLRVWRKRSAERAQLAELDQRMLRDIGLDHATRLIECQKPFWKA